MTLHGEYRDLGRKSVPLIIECGKKLEQMKRSLPHGRWEDWCLQYKNQISITTIKRYIRIYKRSLVTDLTGLTLDESYVASGILKNEYSIEEEPEAPGETQAEKNIKINASKFDQFKGWLMKLSDIDNYSFTDSERNELIRLGEPYVRWCQGEPVVEAEPIQEAA